MGGTADNEGRMTRTDDFIDMVQKDMDCTEAASWLTYCGLFGFMAGIAMLFVSGRLWWLL